MTEDILSEEIDRVNAIKKMHLRWRKEAIEKQEKHEK